MLRDAPSQKRQGVLSRRPFSSSVEVTRSSCSLPPISAGPHVSESRPGSRTTVRAASRQSGSSSTLTCTTRSRSCSPRRCPAYRWVTPWRTATEVGPLATATGRDEVAAQVEDAKAHGATVLCGGKEVEGPGFFYEPTILSKVTPQMRVYKEEVFGPVAMLYRASDEDEALSIANDSPFGLAASVWTSDARERNNSWSTSRSG